MLLRILVAAETAGARFRRRCVLKGENLCFVAPAVHMFFSRTVAGFASVPFRAFVAIQLGFHRRGDMGRGFELLVHIFVAGFAGLLADVQRRIGGAYVLLPQVASVLSLGGLVFLSGLVFLISWICSSAEGEVRAHRHKNRSSYRFQLPHTAPLCAKSLRRW